MRTELQSLLELISEEHFKVCILNVFLLLLCPSAEEEATKEAAGMR